MHATELALEILRLAREHQTQEVVCDPLWDTKFDVVEVLYEDDRIVLRNGYL